MASYTASYAAFTPNPLTLYGGAPPRRFVCERGFIRLSLLVDYKTRHRRVLLDSSVAPRHLMSLPHLRSHLVLVARDGQHRRKKREENKSPTPPEKNNDYGWSCFVCEIISSTRSLSSGARDKPYRRSAPRYPELQVIVRPDCEAEPRRQQTLQSEP